MQIELVQLTYLISISFQLSLISQARKFFVRPTAIIAALAILLQLNIVTAISLLRALNEEGIATSLVASRSPHCNGQCFLMKQLKTSAEESGKSNPISHDQHGRGLVAPVLFQSAPSTSQLQLESRSLPQPTCANALTEGAQSSIFNPPRDI